jgi:hypothetical protein
MGWGTGGWLGAGADADYAGNYMLDYYIRTKVQLFGAELT